jgi:hypothetical protein
MRLAAGIALAILLAGCAATYQLVAPSTVSVARNAMVVTPSSAWNRIPRQPTDIPEEENWTANGPLLDTISFIGALENGRPIVKQRRRDQQRVPVFRSEMSPQDLVSMVESYYRIRSDITVFEATGVQPTEFLGAPGLRFDYIYVGGDQIRRRGRTVMATVGGKLFVIILDAARSHYFDAASVEFDRIAASARLRAGS